jgi:putative transposase
MSRIARRVRQPGVYFVTTDTWQRRRIFLKAEPSSIVLERLFECRQKGVLKLHSFVLMPEHLHLLMTPGDETSLEKAVQMIKGGSAHTIGKQLGYRFPIWQPRFHDRWIRSAHEYRIRKQYIEQNPVKARLSDKPSTYPFGSASGAFFLDSCEFEVVTDCGREAGTGG